MAYTPQAWVDGSSGGTPISAARLNYMEQGIGGALTTLPAFYPLGVLTYSRRTLGLGAISAETLFINATFPLDNTRYYRITGGTYIFGGGTVTGGLRVRWVSGSTPTLSGALQIGESRAAAIGPGSNIVWTEVFTVIAPGDIPSQTITICMTMNNFSGTGAQTYASASAPSHLLVEDMGT